MHWADINKKDTKGDVASGKPSENEFCFRPVTLVMYEHFSKGLFTEWSTEFSKSPCSNSSEKIDEKRLDQMEYEWRRLTSFQVVAFKMVSPFCKIDAVYNL